MVTVADVDLSGWYRQSSSPILDGNCPLSERIGLEAIAAVTDVPYGVTATLDASTSAGTPITWLWEQTAGPTVVITNSTSEQATFTATNRSSPVTFKLTVTDAGSNESTDTIEFTSQELSVYEEIITFPTKDLGDSEQVEIASDADFTTHINDPTKRIFWVAAGAYSTITLTESGTALAKRYIMLDRTGDTHPGALIAANRAKVRPKIDTGVDYWVIDRMGWWDDLADTQHITIKGSNNIINRNYTENILGSDIAIYPSADDNTIQNCRHHRDDITIKSDRVAYILTDDNNAHNESKIVDTKNTKIVNCETYNAVDGVMLYRSAWIDGVTKATSDLNYEGTIVDNNVCYIDDTVYTDGAGNHDINGDYAYAENAMDIKAGSQNVANPVIFSNNKMWGFRQADTTSSSLNDPGSAISVHYNTENLVIDGNIFDDCQIAIDIDDPLIFTYAVDGFTLTDNIINGVLKYGVRITDCNDIEASGNILANFGVNSGGLYDRWLYLESTTNLNWVDSIISSVDARDIYDNLTAGELLTTSFSGNILYDATAGDFTTGFTTAGSDPLATYEDVTFWVDRFTTSPWQKTITKVVAP